MATVGELWKSLKVDALLCRCSLQEDNAIWSGKIAREVLVMPIMEHWLAYACIQYFLQFVFLGRTEKRPGDRGAEQVQAVELTSVHRQFVKTTSSSPKVDDTKCGMKIIKLWDQTSNPKRTVQMERRFTSLRVEWEPGAYAGSSENSAFKLTRCFRRAVIPFLSVSTKKN